MALKDYYLWAALCLLFIELIHFVYQRKLNDRRSKLFLLIIFITILHCICGISITFFLTEKIAAHPGNLVMTTLLYLSQVLLPYLLLILSCFTLPRRNMLLIRIASVPFLLGAIVSLTNPVTGLIAHAESDGLWHVGKGYPYFVYGLMIWYGCNLLTNLLYCKQLRKRFFPLVETSLLMLAGMLIQNIFHIQLFVGFTAALSIVILHLTLHSPSAYLDFNTEVFNSSYFDYWITEQFQKRPDTTVTMIEFSRLEQICNIYPFNISRKLVVDIAEILWQITPHHRVFRLSFNRFVLCTYSDEETSMLQAQLAQLSSEYYCSTASKISCPAIIYDAGQLKNLPDVKSLYGFLDFLLQHTKQPEESQFHKCTPETYQQFFYEQEIEQYLDVAVKKDLLEVWFQPIYSISEKKFSSVEALSRLKHPKYGWISPELFMNRIACKNNMIYQITPLQLKKICRFLKQNPCLNQQIKTVKFNLMPNELLKPDYFDQLISIIRAEGIPTSCFQFEITETSATRYTRETEEYIKKLSTAGIGLCLDDFGSGYANLNRILQLPFSVIKMDRSLLSHLCKDEMARTFYYNMISTLQTMGYQIVAEGVETKEESDYMHAWNVDFIQGYYYSQPLSEQKLITFFLKKEDTPCELH